MGGIRIVVYLVKISRNMMNRQLIESFTKPGEDTETTKYKILGGLKDYLSNIRKNKLYPTLTDLVSLSIKLENMIIQTVEQHDLTNDIYGELNEDISILGNLNNEDGFSNDLNELVKWTRSQLFPILDEGIAVYEFVDENMDIQIVNGASFYKDNGYLIIPDLKANQFNLYSYHCILFSTDSAPIKSIKTLFMQSYPINSAEIISAQIHSLVYNIADESLPVYYCNTDLDFPFEETIFQIARKKLLKKLSM
jgi:hypothetical protein